MCLCLSAKDFINGPADCRKWQDDFYKEMREAFPELLRRKDAELTGRKHFSTQAFKEMESMGEGIRSKLTTLTELQKLRRFIKDIPEDLRDEIRERKKEAQTEKKFKNRERTR